jgi:hypothetical protein
MRGAFAGLALAGVVVCASGADAALVTYTGILQGGQEVPPVSSTSAGGASFVHDTVTNQVTWDVRWWGPLVATAAHVHEGPIGVDGPVVQPLAPTNPSTDSATWTAGMVAALQAGNLYVNIHSSANPDGEIRGQLGPEGSSQIHPIFPGNGSVPPRGTWVFNNATGTGAWFDPMMVDTYVFNTDGLSNFSSLIMPTGVAPGPFTVTSANGTASVAAGGSYSFTPGVTSFTVSGILPPVDAENPTAFPIFLSFDQPTVTFTMQGVVPEPATLGLCGAGALLVMARRRR